ncbi:MAG TPA: Gfo/Idh/MocA family oxidoreductase [Chitinophagaceae bacterium]|jgi:predicted dehydrogenase
MKYKLFLLVIFIASVHHFCSAQQKLKVVLAGLSHDHVNAILDKQKAGQIAIIGIAEPDLQLGEKKKKDYQLPDSIFFKDLKTALQSKHPDLVMVYKAPAEHLSVVEICMPLRIPVMIEKPLAFTNEDAARIKTLSEKFNTKVYTNFPSIWYSSFNELLKRSNEAGTINKMVMRGGHRGPIEVGCSKAFLNWLTDSTKNGGGALVDFGCYGAAIMTELMHGKLPASVYATTRHLKPTMYPKADDAATIILEYEGATGIVEASWDWPYTIMDVEVSGSDGYLQASQFNTPQLQVKKDSTSRDETISTPEYKDDVEYLTAVLKNGAADNNEMLSLERNLIVVRILDAARKSAREGRKILLQ